MKPGTHRILYALLTLFSLFFAAFIFVNGKNKPDYPTLKERSGALAKDPDWQTVKADYEKVRQELLANPTDKKNMLLLAKTFMQEGRITGNFSYYNKAALEMVDAVLKMDPSHLEAICLKAMTFLSQHRFAEARELALQAQQINPYYSFVYGLLCDANVELGNYEAAVAAADKMVNTRPDIRSYSRISYLREIHGDLPGAIEAIQMAVAAGYPGAEDRCWARMVLAHLYEDTDSLEKAEEQYMTALAERPDYPFALAGLGKIAGFKKDYPKAIEYCEKAKEVMADASFFEELIDLYRRSGQAEKAETCARVTIDALLADNLTATKDKNLGHYADMELAQLYLKTGELDKALQHAKAEYQRRPENLDALETLARVLFKTGKTDEAVALVGPMLRTHSQKPERLALAGQIKIASGQASDGTALLSKAQALKPYMEQ